MRNGEATIQGWNILATDILEDEEKVRAHLHDLVDTVVDEARLVAKTGQAPSTKVETVMVQVQFWEPKK